MPDSPPRAASVFFVEAHDGSRDVFAVAFARAGFDAGVSAAAGDALAAGERTCPAVVVACAPPPAPPGPRGPNAP